METNQFKIRSFVRRSWRMTPGQKNAFDKHWSEFGIDFNKTQLDIAHLFQNDFSTILDVGFGMGDSLVEMASVNPHYNFLGVDVFVPGFGSLFTKLKQKNIQNVRVICADVVEVVEHMLPNASLQAGLIFFPDPWPKRRHHKRRLIQVDFVNRIKNKLKDNGYLHFATDWKDYAVHIEKIMVQVSDLVRSSDTNILTRPNTKYEKHGERLGHEVADLIYTK